MLQTLPALSPQRTPRLVGGLALYLLVNGALLVEQTAIRVVAGSLLYFVLPGYFLVLALLPEQARLEQVVLAIASSTALATLTVLATMLFVPGVLTLYQVWAALALLTLLTLAAALYTMRAGAPGETHSAAASKPADPAGRGWWLALLLLLLLAATLRVANLHHAELQDDEIDIASVAVRILRGEDDVVFQDRRGPAQTVITAVAYAFGARPSEWILRLPVVITALTLIVATVVLASSLFNRWLGLLSGLLLSLDGFVLAYARVVQMQSTLLLMMVVAVLCFYQLYRSDTPKQALTYQLLGSLFFGFGILAHYEMVLLAPVLAFLYFAKYGRGFWQHNRRGLLLMVALLLLTTGSFYLAFILNPAFAETYAYYRHNIVGEIGAEPAQDNVRNYVLVALFYNSIYAFAALYIGATSALLAQLRHLLHGVARRVFVSGVLALLLTVWLVVALVDGEARNNVLLGGTLLVAAVCVVPPRLPLATRLLWLWFAIYFVLYLYVLDEVHIHYYAFSPPLAMLSAWGWHWLYQRGAAHGKAPPAQPEQVGGVGYRRVWGGMAVAITMLSTLYLWLVFVRPMPEYALNFPARQHALFPTPYTVRHGEAFGFPHRSGWRTVAWLYRTGVLRGGFETNELWLKPQWYTRWQRAGDAPRYYLVAELPHRLQASPWPAAFDAQAYHLWGVVTVQQQPRLHIYERNTFAPPAQVSYWADEEMAPKLDASRNIAELYRAEHYQADPAFYLQASQQLAGKPDGPLLFYAPEQSERFSLFDQSARPYLMPAIASGHDEQMRAALLTQISAQGSTLYALFWGIDDLPAAANLHTWLNRQLFLTGDEWIGNLRLVTYAIPRTIPVALQHRQSVKLGDAIELAGYTIQHEETLQLSLFWRARAPIPQAYKVFVHLLDSNNVIVSQHDGEPVGGQQPTTGWPVASGNETDDATLIQDNRALILPAELTTLAGYQVAVGMYDPQSGARLPMFEADGTPIPNDMLLIPLE